MPSAAIAHNCKPVPVPVFGALALDASNVELRPLTNVSQLPVKVLQGPKVVISQLVLFLVVLLDQREPTAQFDPLESTLLHSHTSSCLLLHYREPAAQFDTPALNPHCYSVTQLGNSHIFIADYFRGCTSASAGNRGLSSEPEFMNVQFR